MFVGLMFILGLVMCIMNFTKPRYAMLLAVLGAMMLPSLLTAEGLPHALRSIGTAVPVFMLAGMGTNYLLYIWYKTFPINKPARLVGLWIILILLGLTLVQSYRQYFITWAQDSKTYEAYNEGSVSIANYLITNAQNGTTYYIVMGGYEANPIQYLAHNKFEYKLLDDKQLKDLPISQSKIVVVVPAGNNHDNQLLDLKAKFPNSTTKDIKSSFNGKLLFTVFEVK